MLDTKHVSADQLHSQFAKKNPSNFIYAGILKHVLLIPNVLGFCIVQSSASEVS